MTEQGSDRCPGQHDPGATRSESAELATARAEVTRLQAAHSGLQAEVSRLRARVAELDEASPGSTPSSTKAWSPRLFSATAGSKSLPHVDAHSPRELKVRLFRSLFVGRDDVFAKRWENTTSGAKGWAPARAPGAGQAKGRKVLALTDHVTIDHLSGKITAGLYPLMAGDACRLLACDLDGAGWQLDARAYLEVAASVGVPVYLERSRSGNGAHLWTFFDAPVTAATARALLWNGMSTPLRDFSFTGSGARRTEGSPQLQA
ncbi:MAG TPA: hypothetical protein VF942_00995 [Acidimicrobiales bacterium]